MAWSSESMQDVIAAEMLRWNLDLVSAIMPLISDVEVTLRNTIHTRLTEHYGTGHWWTSHKLLLDDNGREMITTQVRKNKKKAKDTAEGPGRVVADLTLGFWVNLLGRGSTMACHDHARVHR